MSHPMDFNLIPGKRPSHDAFAPYHTHNDRFFGGGHQVKPRTPTVLSNAIPSNDTWQNTQPSTRHTRVQPSHGGTYATAPLHGLDSLHDQYSYGRADPALPTNSASLPLPSGVVHHHRADPQLNASFIALSDGIASNDSRQISVPITVPSYTAAQQVYVEASSDPYTNDGYSPVHPRHDGPNSQIENVPYNVFDVPMDYETIHPAMPDVIVRDAGGQPQRIDVNHGDFPMDAFSGTMNYTQNRVEPFAFEMENHADYSVPRQNSPTMEWVQNQRPMGTFESSQDIGFRRPFNSVPDCSPTKRKRSDSPETDPSGAQSPVKTESPTRHSQRREIVGSDATRRAGEKRRKSEATFVCNQCGNSFTRNHNRLNHIRTHFGEAGTQCPRAGCGKPLAKTSLSRHLKNCRGS